MSKLLKPGSKVKYPFAGKWQKGKVHAVKTHESADGFISKLAYLIDTGGQNPDVPGQPEQIEVDQQLVKL